MTQILIADKTTLDLINAAVGATGDAASASGSVLARMAELLTNRLTAARAAYLDAAISTRAPASTALSTATWTAARAAYLDAAISSRASQAGVNSLIGNTTEFMDVFFNAITANTWYTVGSVSGAGVFHRAALACMNYTTYEYATNLSLKITIDGIARTLGPISGGAPVTRVFDTNKVGMLVKQAVKFDSSLSIQAMFTGTVETNAAIYCSVDYSLL